MQRIGCTILVWGCLFSYAAIGDNAVKACAGALNAGEDDGPVDGELSITVAELFLKNKRLPTLAELRKAEPEADEEDDIVELFQRAVKARPELFREWRARAEKQIALYYSKHLRAPETGELIQILGLRESDERAAELLGELLQDTASPALMLKASDRILKAYLRALSQRDVPKHLQTLPTPPTIEEIYAALLRDVNNKDLQEDVEAKKFNLTILQQAVESIGGLGELEELARLRNPARFAAVRSKEISDPARAINLKNAIENKAGFLVTSVNAGIPLDEDMYATMLRYAEDRDYGMIVFATGAQYGGIDRRLLEHPRIHVVTNTIANSRLKIANMGILPKNQNPFASLKKYGQFLPGQTIIVGHPQLAHEIIPTSSNHVHETALWSTGSLSKPLYPFAYPVQARTSNLAKNFHRNAFLVLEKNDAGSGLDERGVPNQWHVRQVEFKNHVKDERHGFTDLGREYFIQDGKVRVRRQGPMALMMGDVHEIISDQNFIKAYRDLLMTFAPKSIRVFLEDPIDNSSSNRHDLDKTSALIRRYQSGELDIEKELGGLVQFDNALAAIPSVLNRNYKDSNHSYWLKDLLDRRPTVHSVVNADIMAELIFARDVMKIREPLEYILNQRKALTTALPPHIRRNFEETKVFVDDPRNARVMPYGESLVLGPEWRPTHLDKHGHQGTNGARPSPQSHASGSQRSIVGDSHRSAILGGWINVGTSTPKRIGYNEGGYSSWTNSTAFLYPDGTAQLLTFDSLAGTLFARSEKGQMTPEKFFGPDKLVIEDNDNDLLPRGAVYDQFSGFYDRKSSKSTR